MDTFTEILKIASALLVVVVALLYNRRVAAKNAVDAARRTELERALDDELKAKADKIVADGDRVGAERLMLGVLNPDPTPAVPSAGMANSTKPDVR